MTLSESAKGVEVRLLGPLEVVIGGNVVEIPRRQVRQVISSLARSPGRTMVADALLDELWPDTLPASPRKALNVVLSRVRATLQGSDAALATVGESYRLDGVQVDFEEFQRLVDLGRHASSGEGREIFSAALELWRGVPVADCTSADAESFRTGLVEHRWFAITRVAELFVEAGDMSAATAFAAPYASAEPTRERLSLICATALANDGRKTDALAVLRACSSALRQGFGVEPSDALLRVERAILNGAVDLVVSPQGLERPAQHLFVGRRSEVDRLVAVGPGEAFVVVGEEGIGKSSLLRKASEIWSERGQRYVTVLVPVAPDQPLDAIARICSALAPAAMDLVAEFSSTLGRVCQDLDLDDADVALTREALLSNLAEFIALAAGAETVVVVDDAQWLDSGSVEVLRSVIDQESVRVVVGMRPTDDPKLSFLRSGAGRVDVIRVAPLSVDEVDEMVAAMGSRSAARGVGARVAERSGGNALFARMLLDRWADGGGLDDELPTDVLVAVRSRLDTLAQRTVESLQTAAVVGYQFSLHTLRQIRPNVDGDLENARAAGLIRVDPATDQFEFVHRVIADACYELLAPGRRVILHDEVGRVLQADRASAVEVANHFTRAAELDPHRAVGALFAASSVFTAGFDWQAADEHLATLADVTERAGLKDASIHAELSVRRGIVGRALAREGYVDDLIVGAKQAKELGDSELMAIAVTELCGHGRSTGAVSVDAQIADLLDQALALDLPPDHRAELCASGSVLLSVTDRSEDGRALYHEAHRLALGLGDVEIEASVLEHAHLGLAHPDDFAELRAAAWRLGELAGSDPAMLWESAFLRFQTSAISGDPGPITPAIVEMRELTPRVKQRVRDFGMAFTEAAYAQLHGDFAAAERYAATALEVGLARYPKSWAMNIYGLLLLGIRREQGRLGELEALFGREAQVAPDFLPFRVSVAAAAQAAGNHDRAAREVEAVWKAGLDAMPFDGFWTSFMVLLAEPTVSSGDRACVDELWDVLSPYAGRLSWNGVSSGGPIDEALAVLAEARGDAAVAAEFRRSAAELVDRLRLA